jgi:indole-3-glycerol phosphate synthase
VPKATYLADIVAAHRARAATDARDLDELVHDAAVAPAPRGFARALGAGRGTTAAGAGAGLAVIAEIKRRSPSKGDLDPGLDPAQVARDYEAGGAACLSVLTDAPHFAAQAEDLPTARRACALPVLRKDFTVCEADVCDARLMGADAVLLIVAALDDGELARFAALAARVGLDALVEVHDEQELERALAVGATLVGVNQRDLATFEVDPARAERVGRAIPPGVVAVAESGIRDAEDARRLAGAGFDAVLVGESAVRAADRRAAVAALTGHPVGERARC